MSEHIRLSLLEEELRPTIRGVDESDDRFDFVRTKGPNPKFWIDITSYVTMGKDKRTYRFQKDSKMGRIVLAETSDVKKTASIISEYIAEQVSEREKMMKEEWSSFDDLDELNTKEETFEAESVEDIAAEETQEVGEEQFESRSSLNENELEQPEPVVEEQPHTATQPEKRSTLGGFIWFFFGLLVFLLIIVAALFLGAPHAY